MRAIYYFFKSLFIILFIRKTKVTPTCRIKAKLSNVGKKTCFCHHCFFNGKIGKYTSIGPYSRIDANIGNYCSIGPNVKTVSACHPIDFFSISPHIYRMFKEQLNPTFKEDLGIVSIGNDVWIGENVLIKGGVKIGNGAVIGMGAVVLDDVPPFAVVGGVPAKVIKYRFDKETIEKLNKSKWWEKNPSELKDKR